MRLRHDVGRSGRSRRWRTIGQFILWICMMGYGMVCHSEAAEWSLLPSMGVKGLYNDNLILTAQPHQATYGYWLSPAAEFAGKTERLEVSGRVAVDYVSYYGGARTDFTNVFLPLTIKYKTEKDLLGFTGGFNRDNTLMSELLDTGLVLQFTQRNQLMATPSWTRSITETLSVQSNFQFIDTTYEDGLSLRLFDYQLFKGSGGLLYQMTEQDRIQLFGSYSNYYTTNAPSSLQASYPGMNLSLTHTFTETLTGTVSGGPHFVSSTHQTASGNITNQETVWLYGTSLVKKFESTSINVNVARDIVPSGFGALLQTDRGGVTVSHDLSETLTASLNGSGYNVSSLTERASGGPKPDSLYFSSTPKIAWKFSEWWKLEMSYTYRWRGGDVPEAMSNSTMFMLTYYPPKLSFSE